MPALPPPARESKSGKADIRQFIISGLAPEVASARDRFAGWRDWALALFPNHFRDNFGQRHLDFWEYVERIGEEDHLPALVAIWPRGSGKSTTVEGAVARIAVKRARQYIWYVSGTQDQSDKHVAAISALLESPAMGIYYPDISKRLVDKYGNSEGWNRTLLRCSTGLSVESIGLDKAVRGGKMDWARPDLIIFDDVDGRHDTLATTKRKIETITESILPAGSTDTVVLFVQNLIHKDSIASRLTGYSAEKADFLHRRIVLGPYKAIDGLQTEQTPDGIKIIAGTPTWAGQDLAIAESQINLWGLSAFLREAQHEVDDPLGGIWDNIAFQHCTFADVPALVRGAVWVDPAVTSTDNSDCHAIQADGLGVDGKLYRLYSWEGRTSPEDSMRRAILKAVELGFEAVGVETDQGGDAWRSVFSEAWFTLVDDDDYPQITEETTKPKFKQAKAGAGHGSKVHRNGLMLNSYEQGKVVHVTGTTHALEAGLRRFPLKKPYDLVDAAYWSWYDLLGNKRRGAHAGALDY